MHKLRFKVPVLTAAVTGVLLASGCGGGGGGGSSSAGVSGVVADGYLVGAVVCVDLNENSICGPDEPQSTTGAGGAYLIENVGDIDHPILAEVSAQTVDEDTGQPVGASYILTAPAEKPEFVSPLTTMVQTQLETNPAMSVSDAENVVKARLGYAADSTVDLFTDYIEAKEDTASPDADDYEKLHNVAQVTAQVLENNFERIEQAAAAAGLDTNEVLDSLVNILVKEVMEQLEEISDQVDDSNFVAEDVADNTVGTIDTSEIEDDIAEEELASSTVETSLQTILEGGVNWLEAHVEQDGTSVEYEYGRVGLSQNGDTLTETDYEWNGDMFERVLDEDVEYLLGDTDWVEVSDNLSTWSVAFDSDNSATLTQLGSPNSERVTGSSLDISGELINAFLNSEDQAGFAQLVSPTAVFPDGATAYRWSFTQLTDLYELEVWTGDNGVCNENPDGAVTADQLGGNCNVVWGASSSGPATSFDELLFPQGTDFTQANWAWIGDGLGVQLVGSSADSSGSVRFLTIASFEEPPLLVASGTWTKKTVNGVELISFEVPINLRHKLWDNEEWQWIYAVHRGYVRSGTFVPVGAVDSEEEWTFNDTAMQSILDNLNL